MYIFLNGAIVKQEEARISPFDHGYMYGLGVFETFRVYQGHPFLFDDHLDRLKKGLKTLQINFLPNREELLHQLGKLLDANQLKDAYVRLNVSGGDGEVGLQVDPYERPTVIMYMKPLAANHEFAEKEGILLETRRNTPEGLFRLKSHHFLNNIIGKREIGHDPNKEGIFLNDQGYISEGVVSNVFWVKDGVLYTPSHDTGILQGVTRQFVLDICHQLKIECKVGFYSEKDLLECDEAFVTNSIQEIVPLKAINGRSLPGKEAAITNQCKEIYSRYRTLLWKIAELRNERIL